MARQTKGSKSKKPVEKKEEENKSAILKQDPKKSAAVKKQEIVDSKPVNEPPEGPNTEEKKPDDIIAEFPAESPKEIKVQELKKEPIPESPEKKTKPEGMPVPPPKDEPIVELKRTAFQPEYTIAVRIYANGKVEYNKHSVESGFNEDKEFSVRPEETKFYADKFVELGFQGFKKNYKQEKFAHEGFYDTITLNYNGIKKTVSCSDKEPELTKYYALSFELAGLNFSNVRKKTRINLTRKKVLIAAAAFVFLLIIAFIMLSIQPKSIMEVNTPRYVTRTAPVNETSSISIAELASIYAPGYEKEVSILVFLRREEVPVSKDVTNIYQYVADDYGNKILVSINGLQKSSAYGPLFTADSSQTFRVTGILRNTYKGLLLEVNTIVPEERKSSVNENQVTETVVEFRNVTVPAKISFLLGISRIKNIFG